MAKTGTMSKLVREHFERQAVNEEYLWNTPFTQNDLKRIIAGEPTDKILKDTKKFKGEKVKTYEEYLKEAGLKKKDHRWR